MQEAETLNVSITSRSANWKQVLIPPNCLLKHVYLIYDQFADWPYVNIRRSSIPNSDNKNELFDLFGELNAYLWVRYDLKIMRVLRHEYLLPDVCYRLVSEISQSV